MKKHDVKWLDTAKEDLKNIARYVHQYSPGLGKKFAQELSVTPFDEFTNKMPLPIVKGGI